MEIQKRNLLIVIVVASIVIISGAFYFMANKPVNSNPEDAYVAFAEYVNNAEAVAATELTIWKFSPPDEYEETVDLYEEICLFYQIEIHDLTVIHSDEMALDYKLEMQNISDSYANDYDIVIEDFCYFNHSMTLNYYTGETEYLGYMNFGGLQVDGLWYTCRFDYYGE